MNTSTAPNETPQHCERCGAPFRCGVQSGDASCWCASLPALPIDRLEPGMRCLCPACLVAITQHRRQS